MKSKKVAGNRECMRCGVEGYHGKGQSYCRECHREIASAEDIEAKRARQRIQVAEKRARDRAAAGMLGVLLKRVEEAHRK